MIVATNPTEVEPAAGHIDTTTLARRINEAHRECERAAQSAVGHAVRCGELLLQAKGAVPHGEWLPWLAANCECSERTAQTYMRIARELPALDPSKAQRVADLPLREAMRLIAGPSDTDLFEACLHTIEHVSELGELSLKALQANEGLFVPAWELYEAVQATMDAWGERMNRRLKSAATIGEVVGIQRQAQKLQNAAAQMTIINKMCLGTVLNKIEAEQAAGAREAVSRG